MQDTEIDNKYDRVDPGDLIFDKDLREWVDKALIGEDGVWKDLANEMNYGKELDVHHDLHKINLND
jgi:hypothetical protein